MSRKVSIVIPVYKTEKYLRKSAASALSQSYENTEIILVDDGSPDGCPEICDSLAAEYDRFSVIHKQNGGLSSARNAGIEAAKGDYILFLDSDDTLPDYLISDMVGIMENDGSDAVIPDSYYKVYEDRDDEALSYHFTKEMFSADPKVFALEVLIGKGRARRSTAVLYRLSVIKDNNIRYPVGRISEDFFFSLDFFKFANKLSLYEKPSLYNLKRAGSISSSYYENFFDTVLEMDGEVKDFINSLDSEKYSDFIKGRRETLLFRNVLIYAINVMGDKKHSYRERRGKCVEMFKHPSFTQALRGDTGIPYFEGRVQKTYMKISLKLIKMKLYKLTCFFAFVAAKINTV
ncbi:MAG: glycosyltransferase family 2 protein [Ruminococcaceae bacterium]|nr:glycosyltransferase family 2 protein [Oscillospiraceae bacterium]